MTDPGGNTENPAPPDETRRIPGLPPEEEKAASGSDSSDDAAQREAEQLSSGRTAEELSAEAREKEHNRTQAFRDLFDGIIKKGVIFGSVLAALFAFTWTWHLLAPEWLRWLSPEEIGHIQNIVTGGVLASLIADHFRRRLG